MRATHIPDRLPEITDAVSDEYTQLYNILYQLDSCRLERITSGSSKARLTLQIDALESYAELLKTKLSFQGFDWTEKP
jgi:hypothetical protein